MSPYASNKTELEILQEIKDRMELGWRLEEDLRWMLEKLYGYMS